MGFKAATPFFPDPFLGAFCVSCARYNFSVISFQICHSRMLLSGIQPSC
jgi:hypothetical protein